MIPGIDIEYNMNIVTTLTHILDLAQENTKGCDGYEQIAEWCVAQLEALDKPVKVI